MSGRRSDSQEVTRPCFTERVKCGTLATEHAGIETRQVDLVEEDAPFHHGLLMRKLYWLSLCVVVYGSLFPFDFVVPALGDIDVDEIFSVNSPGDVLVNILLFAVIGVLATLAGDGDNRQVRLLMTLAIALSILAQVLQAFVPERYPGLLDVVMNLVGLALGFRFAGPIGSIMRRHLKFDIEIPGPIALLTTLFLVGQLYPFLPALRLSAFKENYWSMLKVGQSIDWTVIGEHTVIWFVLLLLVCPLIRNRRLHVLVLFLPLAFFAVRLGIYGNVANIWHLVGGGLGVLAYLVLRSIRSVRLLAAIVIVVMIVFEGLTPFEVRSSPVDIFFVPRMGLLQSRSWEGLPDLVWKTYLYGSLTYLLWMSNFRKDWSIVSVTALVLFIEIFQMRYASGIPGMVDPLLALLSGLVLLRLPPLIVRPVQSLEPGQSP